MRSQREGMAASINNLVLGLNDLNDHDDKQSPDHDLIIRNLVELIATLCRHAALLAPSTETVSYVLATSGANLGVINEYSAEIAERIVALPV